MLTVHEGNMTIAINHIPEQSKQHVHVFSFQPEGKIWYPTFTQTWKKWKKNVIFGWTLNNNTNLSVVMQHWKE